MTREARKLDLEGMNEAELTAEFVKVFGEGIAPVRKARIIDTILDDEFPGPKVAHVALRCPRCDETQPHRTPRIRRNNSGERIQEMRCSVCETWTIVPTGEHGELFQENVDTPDNTDFSELEE